MRPRIPGAPDSRHTDSPGTDSPGTDSSRRATGLTEIPRGIWALGFVSMFMDISSEMIHSLLPVFLVSVLGASATSVGFIEGAAEATAAITKIFSGAISDWYGKRKLLAVAGYGLAALTKPLFPLATTPATVFAARFVDRIGKGIRGAPRDALVGDIAPPELRGACYGLRQSLDTVGAFTGPLLAVVLMALTGGDFRLIFWVAAVPAFISVILLMLGVEEPVPREQPGKARAPIRKADLIRLPAAYWGLTLISAILALGRFSEAFLILRAVDCGLAVALAPMVLVVMNIVYALSAYPSGRLSDRISRSTLLAWGFAVLAASDLVLAFASGIGAAAFGVALWGLHMGLTQGVFAALLADHVPPPLRGTGFGVFHFTGGIGTLLASVIAGALWDGLGAPATFLAGAGLTVLGTVPLALYRRKEPPSPASPLNADAAAG